MKIIFTKTFEKSLLKIDNIMQIRIVSKIDILSDEFNNLDIKKLKPKDKWIFRLRVWKYRILFEYFNSSTIKILDVDNIDSIYQL